ncbi:MAG: hypothetical protein CVT65_06660 [Actinobacteria bacterium HGW-Actinobacteria-5]|jgi:hypothetical protein|nr:MAG: hypothetical protein CVT65_06660 [Actinobacteria bacterium HGW-Actinobacteria-5]
MGRSQQNLRQEARRRVNEASLARQREREARERRIRDHAVGLLTVVAGRDAAVARADQAAGVAVRAMLAEGATTADVAELCGGVLDVREIARLARLVPTVGE